MDSWLKRAEDLFEVVDRRAKLVVSELSDEQANAQKQASNTQEAQTAAGQTAQAKKKKSRVKARERASMEQGLKVDSNEKEKSGDQISRADPEENSKNSSVLSENEEITSVPASVMASSEPLDTADNAVSSVVSSVDKSSDVKFDSSPSLALTTLQNDGNILLSSNHELGSENVPSSIEDNVPSSSSQVPGSGLSSGNHLIDPGQDIKSRDLNHSQKPFEEVRSATIDAPSHPRVVVDPVNKAVESAESLTNGSPKQEDPKDSASSNKLQEQLDEAQGLLISTNPSGKSKEARLARVCAGLSSRLQEYKVENAQLEELLAAERELCKSYEDRLKQLQNELSASKHELSRVETSMGEALAAKNSEIGHLISSLDALKKQTAMSEGNLASLQANMEALMRNRELTETRMMQALREEVASAERRAEDERAAHSATKMAAMEREVELEHRAVEASAALVKVQRVADERTAKAAEFEQKVALLEVECASLNQELQDMEAKIRRGQKKSPEDANQLIQLQAWQEEVERARQGQRDAESKFTSMEAEVQKMRVEMAAMKRDAEHYSRQEHMELEKRYRELTDLLYYKQTQLETMASEKAAAEFQLEKEMKRLQEVQAEAERSKVSGRPSSSWDVEEQDVKELEPLPLHQRHLAGASMQLRKAAKLLDHGAVRATRYLWRYPTARVSLLCYLIFVHLFLMYLLHRLQEQADDLSERDVAKSMGLSQPNLP